MGHRTTRDAGPERRDAEPEKKKLELSAAQVGGSSLATVAAALLASRMGVYGTILGAGVVSVVATAGGPVIQHVFRSSGDRLRGVLRSGGRPATGDAPVRPPGEGAVAPRQVRPPEGFGAATVHGTRVRGHRRTAAAAGLAFALAIGGIGAYEAVAGTSVSADGATVLSGGTRKAPDHRPDPPAREPGGGAGEKGGTPGPQPSPRPSGSPRGDGRGPEPSGPPSTGPGPGTTPTPTAPATPSPSDPPTAGPSPSGTPAAPPSAGNGAGRSDGAAD
ncbi:hypothetical protein ACFWUQ_27300 [Streptomyces sp. NPDC058662]|uniref:hypothetical protein n=1 Tax=Streptomyces sp. NPDC058662 TaxID=3346583 RepID=UPI00366272C7